MPGECSGYFDGSGIEFHPSYQDAAVYWVRSDPHLNWIEKKELILCWFDTAFGQWNGFRYDLKDSRSKMSAFLKTAGYDSFEQLLQEDTTP